MLIERVNPNAVLRGELGRLADTALRNFWNAEPWPVRGEPRVHALVEEHDSDVLVRVELPGVDPEWVGVTLSDDVLTLTVDVPAELAPEDQPLERFRSFKQMLRMPCPVDGENADASSRHGVLRIRFPKPSEVLPKQIPITVT